MTKSFKDYLGEIQERDLYPKKPYEGNDFYYAYGDMYFNDDEIVDEAEYRGRKVKLGKSCKVTSRSSKYTLEILKQRTLKK